MKPVQETYASIRRRLLSKCKGVLAEREEMESLAPQYFQYVDCEKHLHEDWKRIIYIVRLIGSDRAAEIIESDQTGILREIAGNPPQSDDASVRLSLWKAMREYLRESGESKVADIRAFLDWLGYENVTRQAIESAVKRHKTEFSARTKGRDRIVSLRVKEDSASSDDH
jgi:hypothetical protein